MDSVVHFELPFEDQARAEKFYQETAYKSFENFCMLKKENNFADEPGICGVKFL